MNDLSLRQKAATESVANRRHMDRRWKTKTWCLQKWTMTKEEGLDKLTNQLTVELVGSKKVLAGGKSESHTTYTVSVQLDGRLWTVHRRYSQFNNLSRIIIAVREPKNGRLLLCASLCFDECG